MFPSVHIQDFVEYTRSLESDGSLEDGYDRELNMLDEMAHRSRLEKTLYDIPRSLRLKNRYSNIIPTASTRVILKDSSSDYINANFVEGHRSRYIVTQAPVQHSIEDFWKMTWDQASMSILMLTKLVEDGRTKAHPYWNESPDEILSLENGLSVQLMTTCTTDDLLLRTFKLCNRNNPTSQPRMLTHLQYTGWPDHDVPVDYTSFIALIQFYRQLKPSISGPIIVHCSAGIGRSGTLIAFDIALDQIKDQIQTGASDPTISLPSIIYRLREQRYGMVQTKVS
jgi:protein tyrosine phosphatase